MDSASHSPYVRTLLTAYRRNAKNRNQEFCLNNQQFHDLITQECFYCGVPPKIRKINSREPRYTHPIRTNGIDRVDNNKGYTTDNCVPCCGACNLMKRSLSLMDFLRLCGKIFYKHQAYIDAVTSSAIP